MRQLSVGTATTVPAGARQRLGTGRSLDAAPAQGAHQGPARHRLCPGGVFWASLPPWAQAAPQRECGGGVRARSPLGRVPVLRSGEAAASLGPRDGPRAGTQALCSRACDRGRNMLATHVQCEHSGTEGVRLRLIGSDWFSNLHPPPPRQYLTRVSFPMAHVKPRPHGNSDTPSPALGQARPRAV